MRYIKYKCDNCKKTYEVIHWRKKFYEARGQVHHFCTRECHRDFTVGESDKLRKAREKRARLRLKRKIDRCRNCGQGIWNDGTHKCYMCRKQLKKKYEPMQKTTS